MSSLKNSKISLQDKTTFPFRSIEVLGSNEHEFNKETTQRTVFCEKCKYSTLTRVLVPLCSICNGKLYNEVKSHFTNDGELA